MRIIGGSLKGRIIQFLKTKNTRPLKDSVRESIFNILSHSNEINVELKNAFILDIYSGIGSFGLECLSRGAKMVTFVEIDSEASTILKENLLKLSIGKQAEIIKNRIENIKNWKKTYNIFFFDPPFKDNSFLKVIDVIKKNKIYNNNNIIVIHREKNSDDGLEKLMNVFLVKKYGRSQIIFGSLTN